MYSFHLQQAQHFKNIFDTFKEILTDANIFISPHGIKMTAMDSAHISLVHLRLVPSFFNKYTCDTDHTIGLHLPYLSMILKCIENDDSLTIFNEDDESLMLVLQNSKTEKKSEFRLNLIELDTDEMEIPELEPEFSCLFKTTEISKTITSLSHFGDTCNITHENNCLAFTTQGDMAAAKIQVPSHATDVEMQNDEYSQCFPIKFIHIATKAHVLNSFLKLQLFQDCPVSITYELTYANTQNPENPENPQNKLQFFIAPKFEDED